MKEGNVLRTYKVKFKKKNAVNGNVEWGKICLHYDAEAIAFKLRVLYTRSRAFWDEKNELLDIQFVIYYNPKTSKTTPNRSEPNRTEDLQFIC